MKKVGLFFALAFVAFFSFLTPAEAKVIVDQESVLIGADEIVEDDLFISGGTITIRGIVDGDVFAAGGIIEVEGEIKGDLVVAGGTLNLSGVVEDDLWVAGGSVRIVSAQIGDSLLAAGGMVEVDEETTVGGSLLMAGGTVSNRAAVGRNFFAGGGMVNLNASVGGEARLAGEQITIGEAAAVEGDLVYEAQEEFDLSPLATVSGQVRKVEVTRQVREFSPTVNRATREAWRSIRAALRLWSLVAAVIVGLVFVALFPKSSVKIGTSLSQNPFKAMLAGLITMIAVGPVVFLTMITVVGLPLGLLAMALFGVYMYLVKIFVAMAIAQWLEQLFKLKKLSRFAGVSLGLLVYYVVGMVPFVGVLARILGGLMGLGAGWLYFKGKPVKK